MDEMAQKERGKSLWTSLSKVPQWVAIALIRGYQRWVSPFLPPTCRFTPSCSTYTIQAIQRFGLLRGGWLGLLRLLRCHPLHPGGEDPVPEKWPYRKRSRVAVLLLFLLLFPLAGAAKEWTQVSLSELLVPPSSVEQAAADWTQIQAQLTAVQETRDERFARLKLREGVVLVTLKRLEESLQALNEVVTAYQQALRQARNREELVALTSFKELAVAAAYRKVQILAERDGPQHRNTVKALEEVENLLKAGGGSYGAFIEDIPLWAWDPKDQEVRRYESAYAVVSNELDAIYRTGWNYQLFDALVGLCGRDPRYSYGLAVILLAFLLRVLMHPLNRKAMRSFWKMQALQPLLKDLQERYRDDPQRLNAEIWALYRKHKVNPLGGCLPLLLQLPILFWVYYGVLHYRFQFAKAGFLWVKNLALPDYLLFALYLATFFVSTFFMSTPTQDPTQRQQQILMNVMFVVMFAMFFHSFPAAFILYWLAFQVFYIGENLLMKRVYARETMPVREVVAEKEEKPKQDKAKAKAKGKNH